MLETVLKFILTVIFGYIYGVPVMLFRFYKANKWFEINRPIITSYKPLIIDSNHFKRKDGTTAEFIEVLAEKNSSEDREIVFLHGFFDVPVSWISVMKLASKRGYRCLAPYQRGYCAGSARNTDDLSQFHIDTMAADIAEFIESECRTKNPIVVGHDGGGINGYHFCRNYPDMVKRFVAISAPTKEGLAKSIRSDIRQVALSFYVFFFNVKNLPETLFAFNDGAFSIFAQVQMGMPIEQITTTQKYMNKYEDSYKYAIDWYRANCDLFAKNAKAMDTDITIIWGDQHTKILSSQPEFDKQFLGPNVSIQHLDANHNMHFTQPDKLIELII